jgi:hypothetical protein
MNIGIIQFLKIYYLTFNRINKNNLLLFLNNQAFC